MPFIRNTALFQNNLTFQEESKNAFIASDSDTEEAAAKSPKDSDSSKDEKKKSPKTKSKNEKKKEESAKIISSSDDDEPTNDSIPDFLKSSDDEADEESDKESNGSDFEPEKLCVFLIVWCLADLCIFFPLDEDQHER